MTEYLFASCSQCGMQLKVPGESVGKSACCPQCQRVFVVECPVDRAFELVGALDPIEPAENDDGNPYQAQQAQPTLEPLDSLDHLESDGDGSDALLERPCPYLDPIDGFDGQESQRTMEPHEQTTNGQDGVGSVLLMMACMLFFVFGSLIFIGINARDQSPEKAPKLGSVATTSQNARIATPDHFDRQDNQDRISKWIQANRDARRAKTSLTSENSVGVPSQDVLGTPEWIRKQTQSIYPNARPDPLEHIKRQSSYGSTVPALRTPTIPRSTIPQMRPQLPTIQPPTLQRPTIPHRY